MARKIIDEDEDMLFEDESSFEDLSSLTHQQLIAIIEGYRCDGLEGLYHSLSFQINNINREIRSASVTIKSTEDKAWERLMKLMVDSRAIAENIFWLEEKLKLRTGDNKIKTNARPPIEQMAQPQRSFKKG